MDYSEVARQVKADSFKMASLSEEIRNGALDNIANKLDAERQNIFAANQADMDDSRAAGLPEPIINRLKFDDHKLDDCISGIRGLIGLADPLFHNLLERSPLWN